jgi:hypothetical protein
MKQFRDLLALLVAAIVALPASSQELVNTPCTSLPRGYVSDGGLLWLPVKFHTGWDAANNYCKKAVRLGVQAWRLPARDELRQLYRSGSARKAGWDLPGYQPAPWTSDEAGTGSHYNFSLHNGQSIAYMDKTGVYVTCVYAGPIDIPSMCLADRRAQKEAAEARAREDALDEEIAELEELEKALRSDAQRGKTSNSTTKK